MINWDSLNPTPPSLVYPPDASKWYVRRGLPGTQTVTAPNGKTVCIGEIRGWLRSVDGACNDVDPDWHYELEIDPEWLDSLKIPLELYLLPGDVLNHQDGAVLKEVQARSSVRAVYSPACCEIELDGWQRTDTHRGQPPQPATWSFRNDCNGGKTVWPFNPLNPKAGDPPLAAGQYVRMVGSLVSDEPHMMQDQFATNFVLRFGYDAAVAALGRMRADFGQSNAIKWLWGPKQPETSEEHPARFNEIHSPDFISVLPSKQHAETTRCVAVVAQNGLFSGDTEELTVEIRPPIDRPSPLHVLNYSKHIGPSTIPSTVLLDEVQVFDDHIRVHVRVQGQSGMGASGKFFAAYRVEWQLVPTLDVSVKPYPISPGVPTTLTVHAQDAKTGKTVSGKVLITGMNQPVNTDAPFTHTFPCKKTRVKTPDGWVTHLQCPGGLVRATGYEDAPIDFGFPDDGD